MEQVLRLHGTACWRQYGSIATKLSRLDACNDGRIKSRHPLCRTQASSHSSQGVVDDGVDKASVNTATPDRSAVFCG